MKRLTEKKILHYLDITHFLLSYQPYSVWSITQDLIKFGRCNIQNPSLYEVSTNTWAKTSMPEWKKVIKVR